MYRSKIPTIASVVVMSMMAAQPCFTQEPEEAPAAPTLEELANATYKGVYDEPIKLEDGVYEGAPFVEGGASRPRVELVRAVRMTGDLNGDGHEESVVFLSENSGGSGVQLYVAVVGRTDGAITNLGTAIVGGSGSGTLCTGRRKRKLSSMSCKRERTTRLAVLPRKQRTPGRCAGTGSERAGPKRRVSSR